MNLYSIPTTDGIWCGTTAAGIVKPVRFLLSFVIVVQAEVAGGAPPLQLPQNPQWHWPSTILLIGALKVLGRPLARPSVANFLAYYLSTEYRMICLTSFGCNFPHPKDTQSGLYWTARAGRDIGGSPGCLIQSIADIYQTARCKLFNPVAPPRCLCISQLPTSTNPQRFISHQDENMQHVEDTFQALILDVEIVHNSFPRLLTVYRQPLTSPQQSALTGLIHSPVVIKGASLLNSSQTFLPYFLWIDGITLVR
ncbi:hypothetical protein BO94DRAFT_542923 [Aspergillus sclerotioniger CBS 115572]|uniref:Uncharacterized protein n=1 Tax=Aspergillus sclerotioniger CBS 115572 TaxID=1450535 RepID=A0A317XAQ2_9EURO|nr:hypothetical protein BO94DRAFT_542923 [Aspergillus sclerotioniger CBS 115572]PWY94647.1 hypothetical protein BO94DRAFT_542923 [Aspergillus sclerotioniger CBS 115572]